MLETRHLLWFIVSLWIDIAWLYRSVDYVNFPWTYRRIALKLTTPPPPACLSLVCCLSDNILASKQLLLFWWIPPRQLITLWNAVFEPQVLLLDLALCVPSFTAPTNSVVIISSACESRICAGVTFIVVCPELNRSQFYVWWLVLVLEAVPLELYRF